MSPVAEWRAVTRRYGSVTAVHDVTLALEPGQATALVGHNGAGKTTLIKLLLGLIRPDEGSIRVEGLDPAGARGAEARRALGFLPENVAFHGAMTGTELLAFYARLKRQPQAGNRDLLERVGLSQAANRRVATYSKGMRQRLGIAQALIGVPRLLLFDEPTSGLDPASRTEVYALIDTLRQGGATVLVSTHALAEIEQHVDRVAIMHRSRLIAAGSLAELRRGARADARLQVRVAPGSFYPVLQRLPADVRCVQRDETELVLMVPADLKLGILRTLLAMTDVVRDVDVTVPGLQQLYGQLVDGADDPVGDHADRGGDHRASRGGKDGGRDCGKDGGKGSVDDDVEAAA